MGQAIRATAQNPRAARVMGIDTEKVYSFTFCLNGAICGAAGALIVMIWLIQPFYGIPYSIRAFVIVTAAGLGILIVAGITLYPSLRERYWIWKLESGTWTEREEAVERLGELGSVRTIQHLIEAVMITEGSLSNWWINPATSRFVFEVQSRFGSVRETGYPVTPIVFACIDAIRSISKRTPENAERLLRSYLRGQKELARAVAASILFEGTDRVRQYVSRDRIFTGALKPRRRSKLRAL